MDASIDLFNIDEEIHTSILHDASYNSGVKLIK